MRSASMSPSGAGLILRDGKADGHMVCFISKDLLEYFTMSTTSKKVDSVSDIP